MKIFSIITCYKPNNNLSRLVLSIYKEEKNIILKLIIQNKDFFDKKEILNINLEKNYGIAYAQNRGVELAKKLKADFIVFFDQDSLISKFFFKNLLLNVTLNCEKSLFSYNNRYFLQVKNHLFILLIDLVF